MLLNSILVIILDWTLVLYSYWLWLHLVANHIFIVKSIFSVDVVLILMLCQALPLSFIVLWALSLMSSMGWACDIADPCGLNQTNVDFYDGISCQFLTYIISRCALVEVTQMRVSALRQVASNRRHREFPSLSATNAWNVIMIQLHNDAVPLPLSTPKKKWQHNIERSLHLAVDGCRIRVAELDGCLLTVVFISVPLNHGLISD